MGYLREHDIVLTSSSEDFSSSVIKKLGLELALKDLGPLCYVLEIHITTLKKGDILISQEQYLASLLEQLGLQNLKPAETPMESKLHFPTDKFLDEESQRRYRQTI